MAKKQCERRRSTARILALFVDSLRSENQFAHDPKRTGGASTLCCLRATGWRTSSCMVRELSMEWIPHLRIPNPQGCAEQVDSDQVRQARHERNRQRFVRPRIRTGAGEPVEGRVRRCLTRNHALACFHSATFQRHGSRGATGREFMGLRVIPRTDAKPSPPIARPQPACISRIPG